MPEHYRIGFALIIAVLAFSLAFLFINRTSKETQNVKALSLEDVIAAIKGELQQMENTPGPRIGLELSEIKVALLVEEESGASGEVGLSVPVFEESKFSAGKVVTGKATSKVTVVLVPPQGTQLLSAESGSEIELTEILLATRRALHQAMETEPKLEAKSIEVQLAFVLTVERSDSAAVKAKVISVQVGSKHLEAGSNTVTLTYLNPKFQDKKKNQPRVIPP